MNNSFRPPRSVVSLIAALTVFCATSSSFAQTRVWNDATSSWFTPSNWTPAGPPGAGDNAIVDNGGTPFIASPGATALNLELGVSSGLGGNTQVRAGGTLAASANILVGYTSGTGTFNISGGGTASNAFDAIIGFASGTTGISTVTGAGSTWTSAQGFFVGFAGTGTLNVTNGGQVFQAGAAFNTFLGFTGTGDGTISVDGAGSLFQANGNLYIGGNTTGPQGLGLLRIDNGGTVSSMNTTVWNTGTIEIGVNPMLFNTTLNYAGGTLRTIHDTTFFNDVILHGGGIIVDSNGFDSTLSGIYSDIGSFTKIGAGSIRLTNSNTYNGKTFIEAGTLIVDNLNALGANDVILNGGTLQTVNESPRTFNVNHDYFQNGGTLRIQIGSPFTGINNDLMLVHANANLSSELFVHRVDTFMPAPGTRVTIIETDLGTVNGTFDTVNNDFPGLIQPTAEYFTDHVDVVFQLGSFTSVPGLTFNQNAVAVALNAAFADMCLPTSTFTILGNQPIATLPNVYDLIAPEEFAAMYEMSFSRATVQNGNLQGRMDQIRANADPNCGPIVEINPMPEGKNVVGKNVMPPAPAPAPDNRWGTFAMGSGQYVRVEDHDENADGYKIANGSFLAGLDYRVLHNLAIGIYGGYVGSESNLVGHGQIITDGGTVGGYATFFSHGFYLQAAGGGGWNSYENLRTAFLGTAHSRTDGSEINGMGALGYDWSMNFNAANHPGSLTVGPIASIQYTNLDIDGFRERGSLVPLEFPGQSEDSLRGSFGGKLAICLQTDHGIMLRPEVRVSWLEEFNDRAYPINARFVGCDDLFTVHGPRIGEDAAQVLAGLTVQFNPMVALYAHYEGLFGRDNYRSDSVSGGLALSF
jgi:T5SS/PEP-CTERM-associated repeat protein/autotransporter-associated beta strand protein